MELKDLAALIEDQGRAWEAFKKANDARLAAIEAKGYAPAELTEKVEKINADIASIGKQMTDIEKKAGRPKADGDKEVTPEQAEYRKAFGLYLRKGRADGLEELGRKAMNTGSDPDGGYLVVPEMDLAIDRVAGTMGGLAPLCDTITIGTAKWEKLVKTSGMAMRRVAEGATGGETTEPKFAKVAIEVFPAEVEPWVFNETLEDSRIDLESDLANEAAIGFTEGANAEYITGNGVGKARGITAYTNVLNSAYAWGSVGYVVSGKTAAFASVAPSDKIVDLQHALKSQYRQGAAFVMNDSTLGTVRQLKDGSGSYYLWNPDAAAGFGGRLLGSPVVIDDNMANVGAGAYAIAFGNWKRAYKIVNRAGTTLIRDNITAKGQTKFNFRRRFGGGVVNYEAFKLFKVATS
jgi:HK97 family phage major capsid protein